MSNVTLTIHMDHKCVECRKHGATPCGLCLICVSKAMDQKRKMKTAQGIAMQEKLKRQFAAEDGAKK